MSKKILTLSLSFILSLFLFINASNAMVVLDDNSNYLKDAVRINIQPGDIAENAYIFINNGVPTKYISQNQIIPFFRSNLSKTIKIEIKLTEESRKKYKNKTIFIPIGTKKNKYKFIEKIIR